MYLCLDSMLADFEYMEDPVVVSDNLITSRGPGEVFVVFESERMHLMKVITAGTTFPFALTLVELLCGGDRREEIRGPMVFPPNTPF